MKKNDKFKYLAVIATISTCANSSTFEPIPLTEYSCSASGPTVQWNDTSTWFNLTNITNTIFRSGCKYAQRKIRASHKDDIENLLPNMDYLVGPIGCASRSKVPMNVVGAHTAVKGTKVISNGSYLSPGLYNIVEVDNYTIAADTPYELHQKDQSKRGTNRLDKWYSQWVITKEYTYATAKEVNAINGRENGHSNTGPMTFDLAASGWETNYSVVSNMSRGTREYSFSIGGSLNGDFSGDVKMSWPSAKINGEKCYATTYMGLKVEPNTKPDIHSITKSSNNLVASASDKHTTDGFLSYTWEITDRNNTKHYRTGKTVSLNGIAGNYYAVVLNVSDGNKSSSLSKIFEYTAPPPRPIDVRPCPTCAIP